MLKTIKDVLLAVSSVLLFVEIHLSVESALVANQNLNLDPQRVGRLRKMFNNSQNAAQESLHEMTILKQLMQASNFIIPGDAVLVNQGGQTHQGNSNKILYSFPNQDIIESPLSRQTEQVEDTKNNDNTNSNEGPVGLASQNEARQSGLFSGFMPNIMATNPLQQPSFGLTGTNPLFEGMGNLLKQTKNPFAPATPKPAPPPRSSLIGNNGGSTALTNDNVVVVNVLSYN